MRPLVLFLLCALLPAVSRAQGSAEDFSAPPLVEVEEPGTAQGAHGPQRGKDGTGTYSPGTKGAQRSLFAAPEEPPPPEVGLMVTESLFGMLTAAGTGLLGYYLLVRPLGQSGAVDPAVANLVFVLTFASVPMAVAQTQLNLANGSRYYVSDSWPAYLSSLGAQAAVVGAFYALGGVNGEYGERVLLLGTVVGVPLVTMAVINATKQPKRGSLRVGSIIGYAPADGFVFSAPALAPAPVQTAGGFALGVQVPLAAGRF